MKHVTDVEEDKPSDIIYIDIERESYIYMYIYMDRYIYIYTYA